jgi:hypothetical protein
MIRPRLSDRVLRPTCVALATVSGVNVLVSCDFKHIVDLGRMRLSNAVNLEQGCSLIEIRTPREVLNEGNEEEL